jgi:hypothetical protein
MTMEIYGVTLFCDDLRFEQGNKFTLVGCYGPEMLLHTPLPVVLPKLGILVQARFPVARLPLINVNIYMPEADEPFFTQELIKEEKDDPPVPVLPEKPTDLIMQRGFVFPFLFSPFVIEKAGHLRVRLLYGDEVIRVGALKLTAQPPESPATAPVPGGNAV